MDPYYWIFTLISSTFVAFMIAVNIEYQKLRKYEVEKSDEEKFQEWLDSQW